MNRDLHLKIQSKAFARVGNDYKQKRIVGREAGKNKYAYYYSQIAKNYKQKN